MHSFKHLEMFSRFEQFETKYYFTEKSLIHTHRPVGILQLLNRHRPYFKVQLHILYAK